jgi:hypothetical protein
MDVSRADSGNSGGAKMSDDITLVTARDCSYCRLWHGLEQPGGKEYKRKGVCTILRALPLRPKDDVAKVARCAHANYRPRAAFLALASCKHHAWPPRMNPKRIKNRIRTSPNFTRAWLHVSPDIVDFSPETGIWSTPALSSIPQSAPRR